MCGKTIEKRLSRLLVLAAKMSYPNASKVKVNHFLQSSGDLLEFYERAESEAPESELGPVLLCSKCSAPLSRSKIFCPTQLHLNKHSTREISLCIN